MYKLTICKLAQLVLGKFLKYIGNHKNLLDGNLLEKL